MGMLHTAIDGKVTFKFGSSNYDGDGKWGDFKILFVDNDEVERELSLEKDEMITLASELLAASELVIE